LSLPGVKKLGGKWMEIDRKMDENGFKNEKK
jgi:hypothetical protein